MSKKACPNCRRMRMGKSAGYNILYEETYKKGYKEDKVFVKCSHCYKQIEALEGK